MRRPLVYLAGGIADRGQWIQTFTGRRFFYEDPQPADIHVLDIAHALGNLCRYAGHCGRFYSVAEHSILVARQFADPLMRLTALLHDATEAYCVDLPRPLKALLPAYHTYENALWAVIANKFGAFNPIPDAIHGMDTRVLCSERKHLFANPIPWPSLEGVPLIERMQVHCFPPYEATTQFLDEFNAIQEAL